MALIDTRQVQDSTHGIVVYRYQKKCKPVDVASVHGFVTCIIANYFEL